MAGMLLIGCRQMDTKQNTKKTMQANSEEMQEAETTPYGKYPELVTYTLGKMSGENNSNMPDGDTYEDNAYTRYLRDMLNVQNEDVFEASDNEYDDIVSMAIETNDIPDIMVVSTIEDVLRLADLDMIEDLSTVYGNCASDRIKDIYESYGDDFFNNITRNGKMLAIPETNIEDGPLLLWIRKDWMDQLNLSAPVTMEDVENIIARFIAEDPGNNGDGNTIGLACDSNLVGESGYSYEYQMDVLFACYNAYPRQWLVEEDGTICYGSTKPEVKQALEKLHDLYEKGIIDNQFLVRSTSNLIELIRDGRCGAFFGPWWAPNNPLMAAKEENPDADWQPYMIATDPDGSVSYCKRNPSYKYVVVRKGYEHPEVAVKILNVMYDYLRYKDPDAEEISKYYQLNVDMTARPLSINVDYNDALDRCYDDLKIISVLFDYSRFEDEENADEINSYFALNVDPTARPLVINVDYNDALDRCYDDLQKAIKGELDEKDMELLEVSYYRSCQSYLQQPESATSEDWAAYTSRIVAPQLIQNAKVNMIPTAYFAQTQSMQEEWWKLSKLEQEIFLQIVTGVADSSSFDEFVTRWHTEGGDQITKEVNEAITVQ